MIIKCSVVPALECGDHISAFLSPTGEIFYGDSPFPGAFDEQGSEIAQALSEDGTLELQVLISLAPLKSTKYRKLKMRCEPCELPASVIIYGPLDACEDVGRFCQVCEIYLQDPTGCDRNVPYRNPHRMWSPSDPVRMTFDMGSMEMHTNTTTIITENPLDTIFSSDHLMEFDTPALLQTTLLQYVSPK